jgi:hypothetical protein
MSIAQLINIFLMTRPWLIAQIDALSVSPVHKGYPIETDYSRKKCLKSHLGTVVISLFYK